MILIILFSGPGLHSSFFAQFFPKTLFQPSEYEADMFNSINAYRKNQNNVLEPIFVDISQNLDLWTSKSNGMFLKDCRSTFDYILNINMMHISPFECAIGLFANSSKLLKPQGFLFTYGPYAENSILTPESNVSFDKSLRQQNPQWGIRDILDLKKLALQNSMELSEIYNLPANNKLLVWKKII